MIKIKSVDALEVKRTYLIADSIRRSKSKKDFLSKLDKKQFIARLQKAKKTILALPEKRLNAIIAKTYAKRLVAFDTCNWYLGTFKPNEVGVWRRAGKLPYEWTNGSLKKTAEYVSRAFTLKSQKIKSRAGAVIPNILKINVDIIQREKYLLPIVFKGGTGTDGRKRLKNKMRGDIDDGCMRSIALTIKGAKKIKAYIGFPIEVNKHEYK